MTPSDVLFLAWQDTDSRSIVPVARLVRHPDRYEFAYIRAVEEARALGFEPLLTFPELDEVYTSRDLPPLLSNRLIPKGRPELPHYLKELGFEEEQVEPFTVLGRSGGRRATDHLEVFAPPATVDGRTCEGRFLARGVRHVPGSESTIETLQRESRLFVMADQQNESNPNALALRSASKHLLAYIPDYLANEVAELEPNAADLEVTVARVNPAPAPVQHRLLCRYRCPTEVGQRLFRGSRYFPVSENATPFAA